MNTITNYGMTNYQVMKANQVTFQARPKIKTANGGNFLSKINTNKKTLLGGISTALASIATFLGLKKNTPKIDDKSKIYKDYTEKLNLLEGYITGLCNQRYNTCDADIKNMCNEEIKKHEDERIRLVDEMVEKVINDNQAKYQNISDDTRQAIKRTIVSMSTWRGYHFDGEETLDCLLERKK